MTLFDTAPIIAAAHARRGSAQAARPGLDRSAAIEAFEGYLDRTRFSADQIRFVNLIVDELTKNGVMEPARLFESPYTDHAPTGPDSFFPDADVEVIVDTLQHIKQTAVPSAEAS